MQRRWIKIIAAMTFTKREWASFRRRTCHWITKQFNLNRTGIRKNLSFIPKEMRLILSVCHISTQNSGTVKTHSIIHATCYIIQVFQNPRWYWTILGCVEKTLIKSSSWNTVKNKWCVYLIIWFLSIFWINQYCIRLVHMPSAQFGPNFKLLLSGENIFISVAP